jgi:cardiolipin synthase
VKTVTHRRGTQSPVRVYAEQALSRAAGATLTGGNVVKILRDAKEHFPAWLEAIERAEQQVHFECYIISDDRVGREFADALARKARSGVAVRLVYDWVGCLGESGRGFYRGLRDAGVDVRCFNPPRFDDPFGVLARDHRKMLSVDSTVGFVTGLCISAKWEGDPARGTEPWRDTGIRFEGPAVADLDLAFSDVWAACGDPLPESALTDPETIPGVGDVPLRVIGTTPNAMGVYRLDLVVSALATRSLWLTDAYFVGVPSYVQALTSAARDGVDVRLLVPGATDVPLVSPLSRSGYRPLLEAGVRVFEWQGSMLHAKTGVVDGRWARVGSTNLNLQSWLGNYELDVAVEHDGFAGEMEAIYLEDLDHATEIVLSKRRRVQPVSASGRKWWRRGGAHGGSVRAAASAMRVANAVGSAFSTQRLLGAAESGLVARIGVLFMVVAGLGFFFPRVLAVPLAVLAAWLGAAALVKSWRLRKLAPPAGPPVVRTADGVAEGLQES